MINLDIATEFEIEEIPKSGVKKLTFRILFEFRENIYSTEFNVQNDLFKIGIIKR